MPGITPNQISPGAQLTVRPKDDLDNLQMKTYIVKKSMAQFQPLENPKAHNEISTKWTFEESGIDALQ